MRTVWAWLVAKDFRTVAILEQDYSCHNNDITR